MRPHPRPRSEGGECRGEKEGSKRMKFLPSLPPWRRASTHISQRQSSVEEKLLFATAVVLLLSLLCLSPWFRLCLRSGQSVSYLSQGTSLESPIQSKNPENFDQSDLIPRPSLDTLARLEIFGKVRPVTRGSAREVGVRTPT